jgi:hypothetical protein
MSVKYRIPIIKAEIKTNPTLSINFNSMLSCINWIAGKNSNDYFEIIIYTN